MAKPKSIGEKERLLAFTRGRRAFQEGRSMDSCPYEQGATYSFTRLAFFDGFLAARQEAFLARLKKARPK